MEPQPQTEPEPQPTKKRRRLRPLIEEGEELDAPWATNQGEKLEAPSAANEVELVAAPSKESSAVEEESAQAKSDPTNQGEKLEAPSDANEIELVAAPSKESSAVEEERVELEAPWATNQGEELEAPSAANEIELVAAPSRESSAPEEEAAGATVAQPALPPDKAAAKAAAKAAKAAAAAAKAAARAEAKAAAKAAAAAKSAAKASEAAAKAAAKAAARAEAKAKAKAKGKAKQVKQSRRCTAATDSASGCLDAAGVAEALQSPRVGEEADLSPKVCIARTNVSEDVNVTQYTPCLMTSEAINATSGEEREDVGEYESLNGESNICAGRAVSEGSGTTCVLSEGIASDTIRAAVEEDATISVRSTALRSVETGPTQTANDTLSECDANYEGSDEVESQVPAADAALSRASECEANGQAPMHVAEMDGEGAVHTSEASETHLVDDDGEDLDEVTSPVPAVDIVLSTAVLAAMERALRLSETQGASCMRLQNALQGEFDLATRSLDRAGTVKQEIDSVFASGARADVAALTNALDLAKAQGLRMEETVAESLLGKLRKEEELEGIWCCLASALKNADRLAIAFWCEEAAQFGVLVPPEIEIAINDLKSEEVARLARWENEASLASLATEAFRRRDVGALQELVVEATRTGSDPSAALAALTALTGDLPEDTTESAGIAGSAGPSCPSFSKDDEPEEEELERLYVSSPNGQAHCFGMYVLVREEKPHGMPVWRQLGGERWLYTDKAGRWSIGSNKVREANFDCSSAFIFCPEAHKGIMPHEMKVWYLFDEQKGKWVKDEDITVASEYVEEVIEPKRKRAAGRGAKQGKGRGRAGRGRGEGQPKAAGRQTRKAAQPQPARGSAPPPPSSSSSTRSPNSHPPPPFMASAATMGKIKALRVLGLSDAPSVNSEDLRKAYRQQALRWHPDRPQNHGNEQAAKRKFLLVREAFEFLQACLEPMRFLQAGSSGGQ